MKIKTALAVFVLALAPGLALAECSVGHKMQSAAQCASGQVWNEATQTCIAATSS